MRKILVIEDNEEVRENIAEILELSGYQVTTTADGKAGVEAVMAEKPDMIICDIMMPVLDGYGVVYLLNQNVETRNIPFIFLTAKSERKDFRKAMELGADDFISKPFEGIDLLKAVEMRFNKAEALRQIQAENKSRHHHETISSGEVISINDSPLITAERETYHYKKKHQLYAEGQRPRFVYYIKSGNIKTYKIGESGKELITNILGKGGFLGYSYVLENLSYKENAEVLNDAEVMLIPKDDFLYLFATDTGVSRYFLKLTTNSVLEKEETLLNIAYNSLRKKVAYQLIVMLEKFKEGLPNTNEIKLSRDNLAQATGIATESLIRTLSDFKAEKLIDMQSGKITILNEQKLRNLPY